jgi:hypothetical protein
VAQCFPASDKDGGAAFALPAQAAQQCAALRSPHTSSSRAYVEFLAGRRSASGAIGTTLPGQQGENVEKNTSSNLTLPQADRSGVTEPLVQDLNEPTELSCNLKHRAALLAELESRRADQ